MEAIFGGIRPEHLPPKKRFKFTPATPHPGEEASQDRDTTTAPAALPQSGARTDTGHATGGDLRTAATTLLRMSATRSPEPRRSTTSVTPEPDARDKGSEKDLLLFARSAPRTSAGSLKSSDSAHAGSPRSDDPERETPQPAAGANQRAKAIATIMQSADATRMQRLSLPEVLALLRGSRLAPSTRARLAVQVEYAVFDRRIETTAAQRGALAEVCISQLAAAPHRFANNARLATNLIVDLGDDFPKEHLARFVAAVRPLGDASGLSATERANFKSALSEAEARLATA